MAASASSTAVSPSMVLDLPSFAFVGRHLQGDRQQPVAFLRDAVLGSRFG